MGLKSKIKSFLWMDDKETEEDGSTGGVVYTDEEKEILKGLSSLVDAIAPSGVTTQMNHLVLGEQYAAVLTLTEYPSELLPGWMSDLYYFGDDLDITFHIFPLPTQVALKALQKKLIQLESTIRAQEHQQGMANPEDEAKRDDAEQLQDALARGLTQVFQLSVYTAIYGDSRKDLKKKIRKVQNLFGMRMITTRNTTLEMMDGFHSVLPEANDRIGTRRNMDTEAVATVFPFAGGGVYQQEGLIYGDNRFTNDMVIYNPWELSKFNTIVVGTTGGGKSMKEKREIALNRALYDTRVIVIDPNGEYGAGALWLGGEVVEIGGPGSNFINPFDLPACDDPEDAAGAYRKKVLFIHGLFDVMAQTRDGTTLSVEAHNSLDTAIHETYRRFKINEDPNTHHKIPPLMQDLVAVLKDMNDPGAMDVVKYVEMFVGKGTLAGMFNQHTTVDLDNRYVVFDILHLDKQLWDPIMYMLMDFAWNDIISGEKQKTMMVVDEAWRLMKYERTGEFLADLSRQSRKFYTGLHIITQQLEDFVNSDYGLTIIDMAGMKWIHKLEHQQLEPVIQGFKLTEQEGELIGKLDVGEALLVVEDGTHIAMRIHITPVEMKLFTTDPRHEEWAMR